MHPYGVKLKNIYIEKRKDIKNALLSVIRSRQSG